LSVIRHIELLLGLLTLLLFWPSQRLYGQNTEMTIQTESGRYEAMADAGCALTSGIESFVLNPSGLADVDGVEFGLSFTPALYRYELLNVRHEPTVTASRLFRWQKGHIGLGSLLLVCPVSDRVSMGLGFSRSCNPFLFNYFRAITWSPLFEQTTDGGLFDLGLAIGARFGRHIGLGFKAVYCSGQYESHVQGDNHGVDREKWATLTQSLSGFGALLGARFQTGNLHAGATVRFNSPLQVTVRPAISADQKYAYLFPDYTRMRWSFPVVAVLGLAYYITQQTVMTVDFESQFFSASPLQVNLFEYNGRPDWHRVQILRCGVQSLLAGRNQLPLRMGYARIPQQYAAVNAFGVQNTIREVEFRSRNIRHQISAGTGIEKGQLSIDGSMMYAWIKSRRNFQTRIRITDQFIEKDFQCSIQIRYSLQRQFRTRSIT